MKIAITEIRSLRLACNRHTNETGRERIAISITIFGTELAINAFLTFKHVPSAVTFQLFSIGVHSNICNKTIDRAQAIDIPPRMPAQIRSFRESKIRTYMSRTDIFVMPTVAQYRHPHASCSCDHLSIRHARRQSSRDSDIPSADDSNS